MTVVTPPGRGGNPWVQDFRFLSGFWSLAPACNVRAGDGSPAGAVTSDPAPGMVEFLVRPVLTIKYLY